MFGQIVDVITLINQNSLFAINIADRALGGNYTAKPFGSYG